MRGNRHPLERTWNSERPSQPHSGPSGIELRIAAREHQLVPVQLQEASTVLAALHVALEAIGAPAFVVGPCGELFCANRTGAAAFEQSAKLVLAALADATAGPSSHPLLNLRPIEGPSSRVGFLVTLQRPDETRIAQAVAIARPRWKLTTRQAEVLDLVGRGLTNSTIAELLGIGLSTVEFHLRSIFDKAGVDNRATLIARLLEL